MKVICVKCPTLRDTKTCAAGSVKIKHGGYVHGLLSKGQDKSKNKASFYLVVWIMKVRVSPRPFLLFKSPLIMAKNLADLFFITNFTFLLT